ncbi:hypothetical protein HanIR_Chr04g0171931 [Helianthus annuus]|nr:hypothetical protein HanIR_Chr04g0171931 [Helianthus annuus]
MVIYGSWWWWCVAVLVAAVAASRIRGSCICSGMLGRNRNMLSFGWDLVGGGVSGGLLPWWWWWWWWRVG